MQTFTMKAKERPFCMQLLRLLRLMLSCSVLVAYPSVIDEMAIQSPTARLFSIWRVAADTLDC